MIIYLSAQLVCSVMGGEGLFSIITGVFIEVPAYLNSYTAPAFVSGLLDQV